MPSTDSMGVGGAGGGHGLDGLGLVVFNEHYAPGLWEQGQDDFQPPDDLIGLGTHELVVAGDIGFVRSILSKKKMVRKREPGLLTVFSRKVKASLDKIRRNQVK